jgi:hypothetical protein
VQIPESFNVPRQFPLPAMGNLLSVAATGNDDPFATAGLAAPITSWRDILDHLPPMPLPAWRGRHRHISGSRNIISGAQAELALNNIHRGQIAHREQADQHRQAVLHAQQQAQLEVEQARQQQIIVLQQLGQIAHREQADNHRQAVHAQQQAQLEAEQARQ